MEIPKLDVAGSTPVSRSNSPLCGGDAEIACIDSHHGRPVVLRGNRPPVVNASEPCTHGASLDRGILDLVPREDGKEIPLSTDLGRHFLYARYDADLRLEG